jgi:hypothetical protein
LVRPRRRHGNACQYPIISGTQLSLQGHHPDGPGACSTAVIAVALGAYLTISTPELTAHTAA